MASLQVPDAAIDGEPEPSEAPECSEGPEGSERPSNEDDDESDDIPFGEDSADDDNFFDEESEEEESGFSEDEPEGAQEKDRLLHWWCQSQLQRHLRKLMRMEEAEAFREPLPWKELELDDYLEIVEQPMDLMTIGEGLESNAYDDEDGLINPEQFWADIALCWDNCMKYYDDDMELEACIMAKVMADAAEKSEEEFWVELETFEQNLQTVDPSLGGVAAAMDVAAGAVEDIAGIAYDSVAMWFKTLSTEEEKKAEENGTLDAPKKVRKLCFGEADIQNYDVEYDPDAIATPMDYQFYRAPPPLLRDHFGDILLNRYKHIAAKDLDDIGGKISIAITAACKQLDEKDDDGEFEGVRQKIPLTRLFPGLTKVSRAKPKDATRRQSASATRKSTASVSPVLPKAKSKRKARQKSDGTEGSEFGSDASSASSRASSNASRASKGNRWRKNKRSSQLNSEGSPRRSSVGGGGGGLTAAQLGTHQENGKSSGRRTSVQSNVSFASHVSTGQRKKNAVTNATFKDDVRIKKAMQMAGDDAKQDDESLRSIAGQSNVSKLKNIIVKRRAKPVA